MIYYRTLLAASLILLLLGFGVGFYGFPAFLDFKLKKQFTLAPNSEARMIWEELPFPLNFKVYVFNVTNPVDVEKGSKPELKEIGPFIFDEWRDKYDVIDNEEDDTVSFNMRKKLVFNKQKSVPLSGEELVVIPHPLVQLISLKTQRENPDLLPFVVRGLDQLFKPHSAFIKAPFMDLFFRGILINCGVKAFEAAGICLKFHEGVVNGATTFNETHFLFGLLSGNNYTTDGRLTVFRGVEDSTKVGKVLQFENEEVLSAWNPEPPTCNQLSGTDGTIFPPFRNPDRDIIAFSASFCRNVHLKPRNATQIRGINTMRFTMDFGDVMNEPENHCFCDEFPINCPLKGTMDLWQCKKMPMIASSPHFWKGDSRLFENVIGLHPSERDHGSFMDFEMMTGTALNAANRIQFNLDVDKVAAMDVMSNLTKLVMPLFWIEEHVSLDAALTDELNTQLFMVIRINNVFKWGSLVIGVIGLSVFTYLNYSRRKVITIQPRVTETFERRY